MKKLIVGLVAVAALVTTLVVGGPVEKTAAHTGDLHVVAVCNTTTGLYEVEATLDIKQTNLKGTANYRVGNERFDGTPRNANNMPDSIAVDGSKTYPLTSFTLPGNTTGYGPWVYAFTKFTDNYTIGSDGQLREALKGDCKRDKPTEPPVKRIPGSETLPPNCETKLNVTKHWEDVTTYRFDEQTWSYVGTTVRVTLPDTSTPITDEQAAVCAGDKPEVKRERVLKSQGEPQCGETTRTDVYTITEIDSVRVGTEWVPGEPVVTEETVIVVLDPKDVKLCPTPTPTPTPEVPTALAVTGIEDWYIPLGISGLIVAVLAGLGVIAYRRHLAAA